jgi:LuxR family maltose regulon positive regulatory protein
VLADCWASLALIAAVQGRLSVAVELAQRAIAVADGVGTPVPDRPAAAQVALAWVRVEEYDLRGAGEPLKAARATRALDDDAVLRGLVAVVAARLRRARGDLAGAIALVDAALADETGHGRWLDDLLRVERAGLKIVNGEVAVGVSEIEAVEEPQDAKIALAVAQARLEQGDDGGVVASLTRVLGGNTPLGDQVSGWLLEVAQQLRRGHPGRARVALDRSLRLAAPEKLRRPFREAPEPVQRLLTGDARLTTGNAWLNGAHRSGPPAPAVPAQRRPPKQVEELPPAQMIETLTDKELEVLGHLAELLSTDEIAGTMFVSVNTIRTHVRSILRKLGVSRRNEAVRRARQLGLITAPNGAPG